MWRMFFTDINNVWTAIERQDHRLFNMDLWINMDRVSEKRPCISGWNLSMWLQIYVELFAGKIHLHFVIALCQRDCDSDVSLAMLKARFGRFLRHVDAWEVFIHPYCSLIALYYSLFQLILIVIRLLDFVLQLF